MYYCLQDIKKIILKFQTDKNSKNKIKDLINTSDVIVLTGGNPEMFYQKVVQET